NDGQLQYSLQCYGSPILSYHHSSSQPLQLCKFATLLTHHHLHHRHVVAAAPASIAYNLPSSPRTHPCSLSLSLRRGCCLIFSLTAAPPLPCPGAAEAHCKRHRELQHPLFLTHSSVATSRVVGRTFNQPSS
ncbi:hypothetical protein PIB30_096969, partial [Stylosanthes scabra]|nr:hypothetical protein [Stylosanthes scabra]